jgi:thioredoxin reductase/Pyruvate/2-oxoacid:ferredoxin oxidoreductase delta subunit
VLRREIGYIEALGVEIKTGFQVGRDASLADIKGQHSAVFIAVGAHGGMRLGIEGEESPGVMEGIRFLHAVNRGEKPETGKRVAVIGGGNTAIDCARAAKRLGAETVTILYRRTRDEMPALPEDVAYAEAEGIALEFLASPQKIIAENGRITAIECVRMKLGATDASGRPAPVPVAGSEFVVPVDTVLAAIGQVPETEFVAEMGLSLKRGVIQCAPGTVATGVAGVFAGGDGAGAKAFVADAIASGKMGALAIFSYLEGRDMEKELKGLRIGGRTAFSFRPLMDPSGYKVDLKKVVPIEKVNTLCFSHQARNDNPDAPVPGAGGAAFQEVTAGLDPPGMEAEISRCFKCGTCTECDLCYLLCPDISITRAEKGGYGVKTDYCKGCGICATTCPRHVIEMQEFVGGGQ